MNNDIEVPFINIKHNETKFVACPYGAGFIQIECFDGVGRVAEDNTGRCTAHCASGTISDTNSNAVVTS